MIDRSTARFERLAPIGRGGMGEVFRARAPDGTMVALKCMRDATALATVRFLREARALEALAHENIVRLVASGQEDGQPWIATELLEGVSLDRWLRSERRSERAVLSVAAQLCAALAHAHARGVVHRDVKPSNVFVTEDGAVKLLDFGVARIAEARRLTASGQVIGTWDYLSPEQARGDSAIDGRSDLFSLGALVYECLTGRPPFAAETPQGTLFAILFQRAIPASALRPSLSRRTLALLDRLLEKNPDDRFVDADAARAEIEAMLASAPDTASDATVISAHDRTARDDERSLGADATVERRLLVLVHCRSVRDRVFIEATAAQFGAEIRSLVDGSLVVLFGAGQWSGHEPRRALRCAALAKSAAQQVVLAAVRANVDDPRDCARVMDEAAAVTVGDGLYATKEAAELLRGQVRTAHESTTGAHRIELVAASDTHDVEGSPFVGRAAESALLAQTVERARDNGLSESALVVGAPGFGKSRLLRESLSLSHASGAISTLFLQGEPLRSSVAFGALRAALEAREPSALAALDAAVSMADPAEALDRVRSVVALVLRSTNGEVVVAVDDAEWIDAPSRTVLARLLTDDALTMCLWVFAGPEGARAWDTSVQWTSRIELDLLSSDASATLIRALCPGSSDERRRVIAEKGAGHPLCIESLCALEAAGALGEGVVPLDAEAAMLVQLDLCPDDAREALKRAAIVGCTFWADAVSALGGLADALRLARAARVIAPRKTSRLAGEREHWFRSPVLASVAAGLFTEEARRGLHRTAAQWLAKHQDADPAEIAAHFELASAPSEAAPMHAEAARRAARTGAFDDAERHARAALASARDDDSRFVAWASLDDVRFARGTIEERRACTDALLGLARSMGDPRRAEASWRACREARLCAEHERAKAMARAATSVATTAETAPWIANAWIDRSALDAREGHALSSLEAAERAVSVAASVDDPWLSARAMAVRAVALDANGRDDESVDAFERASALFARCGDPRRAAAMSYNAAACLLDRGLLIDAKAALDAALALAQRSENARTAAAARHSLGVLARCLGHNDEAVALQRASESQARALAHHALVAACVNERAYLVLANATTEDHATLARELVETAQRARVKASLSAALALSLRLGVPIDDIARGELARDAHASRGLAAVELYAALCEGAGDSSLLDGLRRALDAAVARAPEGDREAARSAIVRRYVLSLNEG
ncbi:MAG: protein kinase [Myxococcales bacterium]|nr:protein kinase [Myxococcales bacterium]